MPEQEGYGFRHPLGAWIGEKPPSVHRSPKGGQCQCGGCGRFFTSLSGFDFHQWWAGRGDNTRLICLPPEQIGMALHPSTTGETWMLPGQDAEPGAAEAARKALIESWGRQERPETPPEAP